MKALTCAATRRRLDAFADNELTVADQIGVAAHLDWCDPCAQAFEDLQLIGVALGRATSSGVRFSADYQVSLPSSVIDRMRAERTGSFAAVARLMFEDRHLLYAGAGAAAATLVCIVVMLVVLRFASGQTILWGGPLVLVVVSIGLSLPWLRKQAREKRRSLTLAPQTVLTFLSRQKTRVFPEDPRPIIAPRLPELVLRSVLDSRDCLTIPDDLNEIFFEVKVPDIGVFRASVWYWREAIGIVAMKTIRAAVRWLVARS